MKFVRISALAVALGSVALIAPASSLAAPTGIGTATVTPTSASSCALCLGGLLVLGQSNTSTAGQNVTVLNVAGLNVLSKNAADANTGVLAAVGNVLDSLNRALCKSGNEATGFCLAVLFSNDATNTTSAGTSHNASFGTLALTLGKFHLRILGSSSSTIKMTPTSGGAKCTNLSLGYLLNTENVVPAPATGTIGNEATLIGVPC